VRAGGRSYARGAALGGPEGAVRRNTNGREGQEVVPILLAYVIILLINAL
jgi:hypothetical protein